MIKKYSRLLLVFVVLILVVAAWGWNTISNSLDDKLVFETDYIDYEVKPGSSLSGILYDLNRKNILEHPKYLLWYIRLTGQGKAMKAGDYRLIKGMSAGELLNNIFSGKVIQRSITIIEGWTFKQMLEHIHANEHIKNTLVNVPVQEIMKKLGATNPHPEGQFLPDTYYFTRGMSDLSLLQKAYTALQQTLEAQWEKRMVGLPYQSAYQALIMASIVEKETGKAEERQQIAGVFVRRIEKNMRLQTDPTVIYGMGERFKGNLRKKDLLTDTPYNTYRRKGLPPTPIALAGKDAIFAALNPEDGDTLYFVSKGDGSHAFSTTLEEHNKAVIKYQLKGRARSFSSYKHKK